MIIPKILIKRGETIGNEIIISFPELDTDYTFLTTDYSAGVSDFAIENGLKFSDGDYIVVNSGNEKSEILSISGSPTTTSMSLASNSEHPHNRGEMIRIIPFNQVIIESSTDDDTYTILTTIDIRPDADNTFYAHTDGTVGTYYKVRFKNEANTTYSTYSDKVIATGYVANSVGKLIQTALEDTGEEISPVLTKRYLLNAINEGRREIDEDEGVIRWAFRSVFNYNLYSIIPGQFKVAVPTDLREPETNKNIISIRVGKDGYPCKYFDQRAFDNSYAGVYHTTLNGAVDTTDTTIILDDSGDFNESGSIDVAGQEIDEEIDSIAYTGNTETTNTLTGVTEIRTAGHADGTDVWQNASYGLPVNYTIDDGYIYFSQPFSDDEAGESVFIDYYKNITNVDSDADLLDEPFYSLFIPYLRYKIKQKLDKDLDWQRDVDYLKFQKLKQAQIAKNYLGQNTKISIDI
jgi:hypothetical protein